MTLDRQLDAVKDDTRRRLLCSLEGVSPTQQASAVETTAFATDQQLLLRHVHLPKLQQAGYVDWDPETGHVRRGPQFEDIQPLLRLLMDYEASNPEHLVE